MPFKQCVNIILLAMLFMTCIPLYAQNTDTLKSQKSNTSKQEQDSLKPKHSAKLASIMSACVPGLGQIYNKKYWKVPVLYAGLGTLGYFVVTNRNYYIDFKKAYQYRTDNDPLTTDKYANTSATPDQLKSFRDYYRHNLELSIILTAGLYIINIVDASVDAHLFNFDISDNLALNATPFIRPNNAFLNKNYYGLSLTLNFKR